MCTRGVGSVADQVLKSVLQALADAIDDLVGLQVGSSAVNEADESHYRYQRIEQAGKHGQVRPVGIDVTGKYDERVDIGAEEQPQADLAVVVLEKMPQDFRAVLPRGQSQRHHSDGERHAADADDRACNDAQYLPGRIHGQSKHAQSREQRRHVSVQSEHQDPQQETCRTQCDRNEPDAGEQPFAQVGESLEHGWILGQTKR